MKLSRKFVSDYIDINDDINTIAEKNDWCRQRIR